MLRSFLYLDESALNDYVSVMEDGLREKTTTAQGKAGKAGGSVGLGGVGGSLELGRDRSRSTESADTAPARFERLVTLARAAKESSGWLDLSDLDGLAGARAGSLVDFECEIRVPDIVKVLGSGSEMREVADLIGLMRSLGSMLGEQIADLPEESEVTQMANIADRMRFSPVIVGEDDESEWTVTGVLSPGAIRKPLSDFDGSARITAKVGKTVARSEHKLLLNLPGASAMPRDERRALERRGPADEDEKVMFIAGPARILDILAIYT